MRSIFTLVFGLGVSSLVLGACSGSSSDSESHAAPVAREDFTTKLAEAYCNGIGPCCDQAGYPYDAAKCTSTVKQLYDDFLYSDVATYDAQKGGDCVELAKSVTKTCVESAGPDVCASVFVGTVPEGGACTHFGDCAKPAGGEADCMDGKCVQTPRGKAGDGCQATCTEDGSTTTCSGSSTMTGKAICYTNEGLYCAEGSSKCEALVAIGGACSWEGCVAGAFCNNGKCEAKLAIGASCMELESCAAGGYCDTTTTKCVATKADGQACVSDDECTLGNCSNGKCGKEELANKSVCSGNITK